MALKTIEEYRDSLRDGRLIYCQGERVEDVNTHPALRVCVEQCGMDYVLAQDPRYHDLFVEKNEEGDDVPFVYIAARSAQDLLRRRKIVQTLARTCFGLPGGAKFTGIDGLNALTVVTHRMDKKLGTDYSQRLANYRKYLHSSDPAIAHCMTDVKGDRSVRPSKQQSHQDFYLRVVDRKQDGIMVRGAKAHISLAPAANTMVVLPCRNMNEADKDYALAFATPLNVPGITMVSSPRDGIEEGNFFDYPLNASLNTSDATVFFEDVFIPNELVFMDGEWQFSGEMAYVFADFHRLSADAYKYAELEILVGAAMLMTEYNGLERASHIQDKLSWLVTYAEGTEALGRAAAEYCVKDPVSDLVYPNPMYSNISKYFFASQYHQAIQILQDISGGCVVTAPSARDFLNPATRPLIEKYYSGKAGTSAEDRLRAIKLVKDISSPLHAVTSIHAEGSLAAQRMATFALADFERYKTAARRVARISDGSEHPVFANLPRFAVYQQTGVPKM